MPAKVDAFFALFCNCVKSVIMDLRLVNIYKQEVYGDRLYNLAFSNKIP